LLIWRGRPAHGIVIGNQVNSYQVYAWETATGALRLLTDRSAPTNRGWISPDGSYVYFLNDQSGNELGHLTRVPFEGGAPEDVTPDLPSYTLRGVGLSRNGQRLAFDAVNKDGFQLYGVPLGSQGELSEPRLIFKSERSMGRVVVQRWCARRNDLDGGAPAAAAAQPARDRRRMDT
jgi:hypothetical protein